MKTQIPIDPLDPIANNFRQYVGKFHLESSFVELPVYTDRELKPESSHSNIYFNLPDNPKFPYRHFISKFHFGPCNTPDLAAILRV